jgi:hypothetical protein
MSPKEAVKHPEDIEQPPLTPLVTPKYKLNSWVRILRTKNRFEKGFTQNWSDEIFKIVRIDLLTPDNSFVLEFNKKFMMPEKPGSNVQQQLEFYIAAARRKLLKHYATVERVYNRAIGEIERAASHASAAPSGPSDKSNE